MVQNYRPQMSLQHFNKTEENFTGFHGLKTVMKDVIRHHMAMQTNADDGLVVIVAQFMAESIKMEPLQPWIDDPTSVMLVLNSRLSREEMPDHEGHKMRHLKMAMPMVLSNRSIITCHYSEETSDGFQAIFHSSLGYEEETEDSDDEIVSEVVAMNHLTITCYRPYDGGMELKQVF